MLLRSVWNREQLGWQRYPEIVVQLFQHMVQGEACPEVRAWGYNTMFSFYIIYIIFIPR